MATKQELKEIAQIMRVTANADPTYKGVRLEMVRLANKIEKLTPMVAIQYPVNGKVSLA